MRNIQKVYFIIIQVLVNYGTCTDNGDSLDPEPVHKVKLIEKNIQSLHDIPPPTDDEISNKHKTVKDVSHRYAINQLEPDLASTIFDSKDSGNKNPLQRTTTIPTQQHLVDSISTSVLKRGFVTS